MRESMSWVLGCARTGGGAMRARAVCVHAALKLIAKLLLLYEQRGERGAAVAVLQEAVTHLKPLLCSEDMEVQERAHNATALLTLLLKRIDPSLDTKEEIVDTLVEHDSNGLTNNIELNGESGNFSEGLIEEFASLFEGELKPVAPKAQKKVPMPPDLQLSQWLSRERWSSESSSSEDEGSALFAPEPVARPLTHLTPDELDLLREARRQEQANNPHYLKDDSPRSYQQDDIPIAEIALEVPLQVQTKRSDKYLVSRESSKKKKEKRQTKKRKSKAQKHSTESDSDEAGAGLFRRPAVQEGGELPEGAAPSDDDAPPHPPDPHRALDLDLDGPLRDEELLVTRVKQYPAPGGELMLEKKNKKEKKKKPKPKTEALIPLADVNNAMDKTEKHKSKKDKDAKKKKSKKDKNGTKLGYEEALGISTPSKEVV